MGMLCWLSLTCFALPHARDQPFAKQYCFGLKQADRGAHFSINQDQDLPVIQVCVSAGPSTAYSGRASVQGLDLFTRQSVIRSIGGDYIRSVHPKCLTQSTSPECLSQSTCPSQPRLALFRVHVALPKMGILAFTYIC